MEWCYNNGLLEIQNQTYKIKDGITQNLWCVYDRDLESDNFAEIKKVDDVAFSIAIQHAEQIGINIAWSNDAFELWILLHFEQIPVHTPFHRNYIYERLTEIFKNIAPRTETLDKITGNPRFNYKDSLKAQKHFIPEVLPRLKATREFAITNAIALEQNFSAQVPYDSCNPCTRVHHLVSALLNA